jgi:hypothetical protein
MKDQSTALAASASTYAAGLTASVAAPIADSSHVNPAVIAEALSAQPAGPLNFTYQQRVSLDEKSMSLVSQFVNKATGETAFQLPSETQINTYKLSQAAIERARQPSQHQKAEEAQPEKRATESPPAPQATSAPAPATTEAAESTASTAPTDANTETTQQSVSVKA